MKYESWCYKFDGDYFTRYCISYIQIHILCARRRQSNILYINATKVNVVQFKKIDILRDEVPPAPRRASVAAS